MASGKVTISAVPSIWTHGYGGYRLRVLTIMAT